MFSMYEHVALANNTANYQCAGLFMALIYSLCFGLCPNSATLLAGVNSVVEVRRSFNPAINV